MSVVFFNRKGTIKKKKHSGKQGRKMQQFRLAICDDEPFYIEEIRKFLYAYISETENEMITDSFTSGEELIAKIEQERIVYDIVLLDVDMLAMRGTEVAKEIRSISPKTVICFITAYEEYAYEAYQAEALGYLKKPVSYAELKRLLNRCAIQIQYCRDTKAAQERYLEVRTNRGSTLVEMKEILYIEKRRNQCVFHLEQGELVSYMTLAEVYQNLDPDVYFYVHQGYIVNFAKVKEVKQKVICLGMDREIPISRKYQAQMRQMYFDKMNRIRWSENRDQI